MFPSPWTGQAEQNATIPMLPSFDNYGQSPPVTPLKNPDLMDFVIPAQTQAMPLAPQELPSPWMVPGDALMDSSARGSLVAPQHFRLDNGLSTDGTGTNLDVVGSSDNMKCKQTPDITRRRREHCLAGSSKHPEVDEKQERKPSPRLQGRRKTSLSTSSSDGEDPAEIQAKHNHSVIERRYRDNLNGKIVQLHHTLQAIEAGPRRVGSFPPQSDPGRRTRKSDIMTGAIQYVHVSELERRHMTDEICHLQERIQSLEKLVKCDDCVLLKNFRDLNMRQAC